MKINKQKNAKGITLIALVITIIVLLILAGVSLARLVGDNGLLTQADKATEQTDKAAAKEKVQAEVAGSYNADGKIDMELLNENLKNNVKNFKYNGSDISEDNKISSLPAKVEVGGTEVVIRESGKVNFPGEYDTDITASVIASEIDKSFFYGKKITNYNKGNQDWEILYADTENIYLICEDYIDSDLIPANSKTYTGSVDIKDPVRKLLSYLDYYPNSENENMKKVAYMLDTEVWEGFKDEEADYAIGGPTLDLFVASFNQTHDEQMKYKYRK